jgi:hypothetical protein
MEIAPLLFDLGTSKPTTRQVADLVRAGGADALTDAIRRADAARYQEVQCRSALNAVKGMPFKWTLNPYRGCTHGCHYCYARRYHAQFELGADDEFASVILVKTNLVEVLKRELRKPAWTGECGDWHGHRLLSANRGIVQVDSRCPRSPLRIRQSHKHSHERTDDHPRQGRVDGSVGAH